MTRVTVVGMGFVGRAWAISFARAGHEVVLWDQDKEAPGKALAYIEQLLPDLEANDLLGGASANEVAKRIRVGATLKSALEGRHDKSGDHRFRFRRPRLGDQFRPRRLRGRPLGPG